MEKMIEKIRKLNAIIQKSVTSSIPLQELCNQLCNILESNIYLFHATGEIFVYAIASAFQCDFNDLALEDPQMPDYYLDQFHGSNQTQFNKYEQQPQCTCEGVEYCQFENRYYALIPIFSNITKAAGLLLIRYGRPYEEDEQVLCEYAAAIISMELVRQEYARIQQEAVEQTRAKIAVGSLSFSERKACAAVFQELENGEGVVFLKAVSDQIYIASSVVSGALKKLEGGGLIRTKSQGVKGKYVTILNAYLRRELESADRGTPE